MTDQTYSCPVCGDVLSWQWIGIAGRYMYVCGNCNRRMEVSDVEGESEPAVSPLSSDTRRALSDSNGCTASRSNGCASRALVLFLALLLLAAICVGRLF